MFDYLVIEAGFAGCVFAERLAVALGWTVLFVDKCHHVYDNLYTRVTAFKYPTGQQLPKTGVRFVGRLGTCRYCNMDQVVAQRLSTFATIAGGRRPAGAVA